MPHVARGEHVPRAVRASDRGAVRTVRRTPVGAAPHPLIREGDRALTTPRAAARR